MSDTTLPELPPLDPEAMLGYAAIRYVEGWPENYVRQYATEYAISAITAERARAAAPAGDASTPEFLERVRLIADDLLRGYASRQTMREAAQLLQDFYIAALAEAAPPPRMQT